MSEEGKSVRFKFVVDEASARQVNRVFDQLISRAKELANTLKGVGGLGGGGGMGMLSGGGVGKPQSSASTLGSKVGTSNQTTSFASVLAQNVDVFKKVGQEGGAAIKVMTEALQRGMVQQQGELNKLNGELGNLIRLYEKVGGAAAGSFGEQLQTKIIGVTRAVQKAKEELSSMEGQEQALHDQRYGKPLQDAPAPRGWKIYQSEKDAAAEGAPRSLIRGIGSGFSAVAGGLMAANFALDESRAGDRSYSGAEARRGQLVESKIRQIHSGDTRWLFNLRETQKDAEARKDLAAQTSGTASTLEQARAGVGQFVGAVPVIGQVSRALGLVGPDQGGGALGGLTTATMESNKAENAFRMLDEKSKSTAMLYMNMAQESFQARMGQSINLQRVVGMSGLQQDKRGPNYGYNNQAGDFITKLEGEGYDSGQFAGAYAGLRGGAGSRFAGRHAWQAMAAQAQGYGGFSELQAASARRSGSNALAIGALGGGIEKAAGIQLGLGVLGNGYDPTGTTTGYGTLAAIQNGMGFTNGPRDFNRVQAALGGLQLGTQITTGGIDPYQQSRNLVGAIGLNPNGSTYSQDYLANGMSMKQMLDMAAGGKMTQTAKDLNLTPKMIESQLSDSLGSVFDRFVDEGADDPRSRAIRKYQKSGMGYIPYLKQLAADKDDESIKTLGAATSGLFGGNEEEGIAEAMIASGMGKGLREGKIGGRIGGAEKKTLEAKEKMQQDIDTTLKIIGKGLEETIASLPKATKTMVNLGTDMDASADKTIKALNELTAAFTIAAASISGKPAGKKQAPAGTKGGAK